MRPTAPLAAYALRVWLLLAASAVATLLAPRSLAADATPPVVVAHLRGAVDPISARYLHRAVDTAQREGATALVVTIDTPGGLDTSMRQMVQDLLNSTVPTVA